MLCELFMEDGKPKIILSAEEDHGRDGEESVRHLELTILELLCGWDGGSADSLSDEMTLTINLVEKRK